MRPCASDRVYTRRRIERRIEASAAAEKQTGEAHWKIPAYQEVTFYLRSRADASSAYDIFVASAASGWTHGRYAQDRWAVWNPSQGVAWCSPKVKWAELFLRCPDEASAQGSDRTQPLDVPFPMPDLLAPQLE
jgi:hypothetical protein